MSYQLCDDGNNKLVRLHFVASYKYLPNILLKSMAGFHSLTTLQIAKVSTFWLRRQNIDLQYCIDFHFASGPELLLRLTCPQVPISQRNVCVSRTPQVFAISQVTFFSHCGLIKTSVAQPRPKIASRGIPCGFHGADNTFAGNLSFKKIKIKGMENSKTICHALCISPDFASRKVLFSQSRHAVVTLSHVSLQTGTKRSQYLEAQDRGY